MKKRSVILGMMSEICMKGRLILEAAKADVNFTRQEELMSKMEAIEAEMEDCSREMDRLMAK